MVLLYHYGFRGANQGTYIQTQFPELVGWVQFGYLGVDLFFLISGFVILLTVDTGRGLLSHFVASRASRLYPVFLVGAAFTLVLVWGRPPPFGVSAHDAWLNLTMVPGWFGARSIDGVYWTLAVEIQFYLMVALYLLVLGRRVSVDAVLLLWSTVLATLWFFPGAPLWLRWLAMDHWGPLFLAGCLYYRVFRSGWSGLRIVQLLLAGALATVSIQVQTQGLSNSFAIEIPVLPALLTLAVFFAVFAVLCSQPRWFRLGGGAAVAVGALTYPLYLIHQKPGYLLLDALAPHLGRWLALVGVIATVLLLAWLLHRLVEKPVNGRLRRWLEPRIRLLDRAQGGVRQVPEIPAQNRSESHGMP